MIFTFAGNIGSVQNLDVLVKAFSDLPTTYECELRIIGGGVFEDKIRNLIETIEDKRIKMYGQKPKSEIRRWLEESDVLVISLNPKFDLTIPAKFQAYLAVGRPILASIQGDTALLVEKYSLGYTADPSDQHSITSAFKMFRNSSQEQIDSWRKNAISLSKELFDRERIIKSIENEIVSL